VVRAAYCSRVQRPHWCLGDARRRRQAAARDAARRRALGERSASGTIIQPTTTIVPDGTGGARVIVIPRRRSYLDTGTEVSVGDRKFHDYYSWPGGDPGRPNWFYDWDYQGTGHYPLPWGNGTPEYSGY
jgi:hypothetical protein